MPLTELMWASGEFSFFGCDRGASTLVQHVWIEVCPI